MLADSYNELRAVTSLGGLHHNSHYIYTPASSTNQHQQRLSPSYHQATSPAMPYHDLMHAGNLSPKVEGLSPPSSRSPIVMGTGSPTAFELSSPHIVMGSANNNNNNSKIVMGNGESVTLSNMDRPTVVSLSS